MRDAVRWKRQVKAWREGTGMKGKKRKDRLSEPDRKVKPRCDLPEGFQMEAS